MSQAVWTLFLSKLSDPPGVQIDRRDLDRGELKIGRSSKDCDWSISDPAHHLSREHCIISDEVNGLFVTDISAQGALGVCINNKNNRIARGTPIRLCSRDRLLLGDYVIEVIDLRAGADEMMNHRARAEKANKPVPKAPHPERPNANAYDFGDHRPKIGVIPGSPPAAGIQANPARDPIGVKPYNPLRDEPRGPVSPGPQPARVVPPFKEPQNRPLIGANQRPVLPEHKAPPLKDPETGTENQSPVVMPYRSATSGDPAPARPPPIELVPDQAGLPPREPSADGDLAAAWRAFCEGAMLAPREVPAPSLETMRQLGQFYRQVLLGIVGLIQDRAQVKQEFRIEQTQLSPSNNNPLKHLPSADLAKLLLGNAPPGYLAGSEAVQSALEDIKRHQRAMLAGMQHALRVVFKRLAPDTIEGAEQDRRAGRGGLPFARGGDHWAAYKRAFDELQRDKAAGVVMKAFQEGYEAFLRRTK